MCFARSNNPFDACKTTVNCQTTLRFGLVPWSADVASDFAQKPRILNLELWACLSVCVFVKSERLKVGKGRNKISIVWIYDLVN